MMDARSVTGLAILPLALVVAGCGSSSTRSTALPSITTRGASAPATSESPSAAASVTPTLISETIAPGSATPSASPTSSSLATYSNPRYGFSARYPADFSKGMPPVDGDGQLFNSPDQAASFTVDGVNNNNHQTVDQIYAAATTPTAGTTITYANKSGNVVTVSGTKGSRVFYDREVVGTGSIDALSWTYPVSDKATFDPIVTLTADTFTAGDVSNAH